MKRTEYVETVLVAFGALRAHKLRSFLTILGVIIGVMTVIVIASILTGMRHNIVSLVEQFGTDNIYAFHLSRESMFERSEWTNKPLRLEEAQAIKNGSEAVAAVSWLGFSFDARPPLKYGSEVYRQGFLAGVPANYAEVTNVGIAEGRFLTESEDSRSATVCVLGVSAAEALFPHQETVTGRVIQISGQRFTVIGVLEKRKGGFMGENQEDNLVLVPYRTFRRLSPASDWLRFIIQAKSGQLVRALDDTEVILRRQRGVRFDKPNDFSLTTADRLVEEFDQITATVGLAAIAISAVGLLVGGIGVMNIMLVSVSERTREIGVRKAVGAKRQDITLQFLFEAMTLTGLGGIAGVAAAVFVSYLLGFLLPDLPAEIPAWAVITGLVVSLMVGLVFGVWPAVKASRLDPIECLRYE